MHQYRCKNDIIQHFRVDYNQKSSSFCQESKKSTKCSTFCTKLVDYK